jgi:sec-independent protein translocase protein TatC
VNEEKRSDLIGHLSELRSRLIRMILYAVVGMAVVWALFDPLYAFLTRPINAALDQREGELMVNQLLEPLMFRMSVAMVGGLILAAPLLFWEIWAFVSPGLMRSERRAARPLVPVSALLFLAGVFVAYMVSSMMVRFLIGLTPPGAAVRLTLTKSVLILVKFYLVFGLCFQLPIVIVFLAKLGIVDSRMLTSRWREAVVGIFLLAAMVTPTWDPITLSVAAVPMVVLYVGTIGAVKIVERRQRRARESEEPPAG